MYYLSNVFAMTLWTNAERLDCFQKQVRILTRLLQKKKFKKKIKQFRADFVF